MEKTITVNIVVVISLCICVSFLIRSAVSLYDHSGKGKPPLYGDYEAQRHWQEVTVNLPINQWYHNSTENDLMYWGLDYPPLTAYHSLICGYIGKFINEDFVRLYDSRGIETHIHKLYMRWTVLLADLTIYIPAVLLICGTIYSPKRIKNPMIKKSFLFQICMFLFYPGLTLIDHGHFQYNNISLGFAIFAVAFLFKKRFLKSSLFFVLALNYKQMELYHALPFFFYLLSVSFSQKSLLTSLLEVSKIGIVVLLTFAIIWSPFLTTFNNFTQVVHRLFPVARGVFEDKVSNIWCAVNVIIKLKNTFDTTQMALICLISTLLAVLPCNIRLFLQPTSLNFKYALVNTSIGFFLFSFQVHEKSILLASIPVLILVNYEPLASFWFLYISTFSMLPLLIKDNLIIAYVALNLFYFTVFKIFNMLHKSSDYKNIDFLNISNCVTITEKSKRIETLLIWDFYLSIAGSILLTLGIIFIKAPITLPDLFPLLISVYSCLHFLGFFVYFNFKQFTATFTDHKLKYE